MANHDLHMATIKTNRT